MSLKKRFLVLIVFLLIGFSVNAQTAPKIATARIIEAGLIRTSAILVVYETGESETIPLTKLESYVKEEKAYKAMIDNQKIINQFLEKMKNKGYELKSMTTSGENLFTSFLIFEKIQ